MALRWGEPFVPLPWLLAGGLLYLALWLWWQRRLPAALAPRQRRILGATRLLGPLLLGLLLMNPGCVWQRPDTQHYQLAVLLDGTGSMATKDCDEETRLEVLRRGLLAPDSAFQRTVLPKYPNHVLMVFAGDQVWRLNGTASFDLLPGLSDLDGALVRLLGGATQGNLGAVLLVSDGLDNLGVNLLEAAAPYRQAGVPIHVLGIGDRRVRADLELRFSTVPGRATRGRPMSFKALLRRNQEGAQTSIVRLEEAGRLLEERQVVWADDAREQELAFELTPLTSGFKTWRLAADALPGEDNLVNNVDYAGVTVADPETFKVLYTSGVLDWNYKFLSRLASDRDGRLRLEARIRLGEHNWFYRGASGSGEPNDATDEGGAAEGASEADPVAGGAPAGTAPPAADGTPDASTAPDATAASTTLPKVVGAGHGGALPSAATLADYDVMIVDLSLLDLLDEAGMAALASFVEKRGGGLLLTGVNDQYPAAALRFLPFRQETLAVGAMPPGKFTLRPGPPLAPRPVPGDSRIVLDGLLSAPEEGLALRLPPEALKPGATAAMLSADGQVTVLATQSYGAGKVALVNLPDSWQWPMASDDGLEPYAAFWSRLISWAASATRERLVLKPAGTRLDLGGEIEVSADLLDAEFGAENNARLEATLLLPDGSTQALAFSPNPRVEGRYSARFIPRQGGEHRLRMAATLPTGEKLESVADYIVTDGSPESVPAPLAEANLQALARLTGGQYWHYRQLDSLRDLPMKQDQRQLAELHPWIDQGWVLALLLLLLPLDWWLRRRWGLR